MNILSTPIPGVSVVESSVSADERGTFARLYCERALSDVIGSRRIVQINYSRTARVGAVRGMHFQHPPQAEMKLVRCMKGRVFDVAIDLRAGSPTFLKWHAEELSPEKTRMLVIPEGCAHGFQALEVESELLYLHTAFYTPEVENGVRYDDLRLGIPWPLPVVDVSPRDRALRAIAESFRGVVV
jgi:dTDP-4-dehydrorhamnose 3,5-epimerase